MRKITLARGAVSIFGLFLVAAVATFSLSSAGSDLVRADQVENEDDDEEH